MRPTLSRLPLWPAAFIAGIAVTLLAYPALDFVQACRNALSAPAGLAAASEPMPVGAGQPHPAFAGIGETPGAGMSIGSPDAPVVLYEFSDFQCPFCAQWAAEIKPLLMRDYVETGKVRFVYIDFPLPSHANAIPTAVAARCAEEEGAFWPMHDKIFAGQQQWQSLSDPTDVLVGYAAELELDTDAFRTCLSEGRYEQEVLQGYDYGRSMGVQGTPWLYVNGVQVLNDPAELQGAIEEAIQQAS